MNSRIESHFEGGALVVDDEEHTRQMLTRALGEIGLETVTAVNGKQALQLLAASQFALTFVDLKIPEPGGMEVLRWASENRPFMPVFVLTAYASAGEAVEAVEIGAVDFLVKPCSEEEVRRHVLRVLSAERHDSHLTGRGEDTGEDSARINDRQFDAAAAHVYEAIRRSPSSAEAYDLLGVLYRLRGYYEEARRCFERALSVDFSYAAALRHVRELPDRPADREMKTDQGGN